MYHESFYITIISSSYIFTMEKSCSIITTYAIIMTKDWELNLSFTSASSLCYISLLRACQQLLQESPLKELLNVLLSTVIVRPLRVLEKQQHSFERGIKI